MTYEIVAVIITVLAPHANLNFIVSRVTGRFQKVLGEELALLIEVISGTLSS